MNDREYVLFTRGISQESINELVKVLWSVSASNREIYLLLNCNGGNVQAGIYCYNIMRSLPTKMISHNVGNVGSVANILFLAADVRYCAPPSTFMFHGVKFDRSGQLSLDERYLREHLDSIIADHDRIGTIMAERSALTLDEARKMFREQRVRDAAWALENGMIHEILDLNLPPGSVIHQLT